jgi:hypothetical protein
VQGLVRWKKAQPRRYTQGNHPTFCSTEPSAGTTPVKLAHLREAVSEAVSIVALIRCTLGT